jgi:stringent starvation protein B
MTSSRPYLIRALFDWIVDNGLTPHLLVDATVPGVHVPPETVEEGRVVLNISPAATGAMDLGNETICFDARFGGQPMTVEVPVAAAQAIYARENGQGMLFSDDGPPPPDPGGDGDGDDGPSGGDTGGGGSDRSHLKVVK